MDISVSTTNLSAYQERRRPGGYTDVVGYTDLRVAGRWLCDRCGSSVGRTDLHDAFHERIDLTAPAVGSVRATKVVADHPEVL